VNQSPGQIGIRQKYPAVQIDSRPGDLEVQHPPIMIDMDVSFPGIRIDMSKIYSEIGLKGYLESMKADAARGQEAALAGIARIVKEGNRMAAIEEGSGVIPVIAAENYRAEGEVETNVGLVPRSRPQVEVLPGMVKVNNRADLPKIKYVPGNPKIAVQKGYVDIYMKKTPEIDITVSGKWIK